MKINSSPRTDIPKTCDLYVILSFIENIEENMYLCTNIVECEVIKMEE